MAGIQFTSVERAEVYRCMFQLNRAFCSIVQRLGELTKVPIFNRRELHELSGLTQELQLEINIAVLDHLRRAEEHDFAQYGKVRIAMERRLRAEAEPPAAFDTPHGGSKRGTGARGTPPEK
jgi:hypothetical protein